MRYRHVWPGVLLLGSLALLLVGLVGWGDHVLSPAPSGGIARLLERWARPRDRGALATQGNPPSGSAALAAAPQPEQRDGAGVAGATAPAESDVGILPASEPAARSISAEPAAPRYSVELGTYAVVEDAERAEARLNQAGFSTMRFRQRESARLFTVTVAMPGEPADGESAVDMLRRDGFPDAVIVRAGGGAAIRVAGDLPFDDAVQVAEQLRSAGHEPMISAEPAGVGRLTLRHGTFSSRQEAEAAAREMVRLGVSPEVVQVR